MKLIKARKFQIRSVFILLSLLITLLINTKSVLAADDWRVVGAHGFTPGSASDISMQMDSSGTPFVAFADGSNSNKVTVMKYTGSTSETDATAGDGWEYVGSPGFSLGTDAVYITLAFDSHNTPYVSFRDNYASAYQKAKVMKFNGTSWESVGLYGFSARKADYESIAIDSSDKVYVAYNDYDDSNKVTVVNFSGTYWQVVGAAGISLGTANSISLKIDNHKIPYVMFTDVPSSDGITVMKYTGRKTETDAKAGDGWEFVGSANIANGDSPSFAMDKNNIPYVAYQGAAGKAFMLKYTGNTAETDATPSDGWEYVGTGDFSSGRAFHIFNAVNSSNTPYAIFQDENNSNKATVMEYTGSTTETNAVAGDGWEYVGSVGFSKSTATYLSMIFDSSDDPYAVFQDQGSSNKITVMTFGGALGAPISSPTTQPKTLPKTGFAPHRITVVPKQSSSEHYQSSDISLEIPSLGIETFIAGIPITQDGWDLSWLGNNQAGWLNGTAFPSWAGNSVITAHVVGANGEPGLFYNLSELKWGDEVIIQAYEQSYVYQVRSVDENVSPNDTSVIFKHEEYPWLTLITCRGYDEESDSYLWRVVVRAVQIEIK